MTETKKEAFRRYLESAGAIDTLTKVLVNLYEEPGAARILLPAACILLQVDARNAHVYWVPAAALYPSLSTNPSWVSFAATRPTTINFCLH